MKSTRAPAPRPGGLGIGGPGAGEGGGSGEFGGGGDGGLGDSGSSGGGLLPVGGGVASPEEPAQAGDPERQTQNQRRRPPVVVHEPSPGRVPRGRPRRSREDADHRIGGTPAGSA